MDHGVPACSGQFTDVVTRHRAPLVKKAPTGHGSFYIYVFGPPKKYPQKILLDCTIFGAHNPGRHRALHTSSHLAFISNKDEARSTGAGGSMIRYMVWVVFEICEGWGCSRCDWVIPLPRLDNTVAALQYNRTAQQSFDVHECHHNGEAGSARVNIHSEDLVPYRT